MRLDRWGARIGAGIRRWEQFHDAAPRLRSRVRDDIAAHRLSRVPREGSEGYASFNPEWEERHRAFHLALIAACGSHWLIDFYSMLMDRNTRCRYLAFADGSEPRDVEGEHRAIVDAVLV